MKTGLVLEGGAMRGMYTAGVLDVLMEQGIALDGAIGVSAGALFGCNYKSRQIGRAIRYNKAYCRDKRYMSLSSLLRTGDLYNVEFCYHTLPYQLDPFDAATYAANPMPFYVVCTDVHTGQPVYHRCDKGDEADIQWMRASGSMPLVSRVVTIEGRDLLDGGISNSIPLAWFCAQGYAKNVVILTHEAGYYKRPGKSAGLLRAALRRYPAVAAAMANRPAMYNRQLEEVARQEQAGNAFVFRPSQPVTVQRTERDPEKLEALYQLGRADATARLGALRSFLGEA